MRSTISFFTVLLTLSTVMGSLAQAAECESFARDVLKVAMRSGADAELVNITQVKVENKAAGSVEVVERLVFSTGASEIVVEALPSYYSQGVCELKSLSITRE